MVLTGGRAVTMLARQATQDIQSDVRLAHLTPNERAALTALVECLRERAGQPRQSQT
jgi:hypothetical protein